MAHIFAHSLGGQAVMALWYHFAIMFEALFILSTLDAGTRVARFMLQDLLGHLYAPLADSASYSNIVVTSVLIVAAWGYFLYFGTIDPLGGINSLWPLFGIANQMLATIALCVATSAMIRSGKVRYAFVTLLPLTWLVAVTMTGRDREDFQRDAECRLPCARRETRGRAGAPTTTAARAIEIDRLIWNDRVDAALTAFFIIVVITILSDSIRVWSKLMLGNPERSTTRKRHDECRGENMPALARRI